ncbi:hypothetical protein [Bradyrhizobium oligotrophicum]|uniref:hypothetical protein n=1 Tax=Bradyrhizobium oligotrophicum TaxID=44255 RepID=UPI003EC14178
MKIDDDHLYHGAALIQIAEHPQFTAINSFKGTLAHYENAYRINDDIAIYLKYASKPKKPHDEYVFTFTKAHLDQIRAITKAVHKTFLALVCVKAREVCCLRVEELFSLIERRRKAFHSDENQYSVLVTAKKGSSLHVYVNEPHKKNTRISGKDVVVSRSAFPGELFS